MIDPFGKIAYVWEKVDPAGHAKKVQEKLEELREVM
jgi:peroxiredoxin